MGKVKNLFYNLVAKPLKNFNVANRAERAIAKGSVKAPPHPSTVEGMNEIQRDYKDAFETQNDKNEQLVQMMQDMVVNPDKVSEVRPKNLPISQDPALDAYFEHEPETVPEGKVILRDAMNFITMYHFYPKGGDNTVSNIADKFKLEPLDVEILLRHFKPFEIHYPLTEEQKMELEERARLAEPQEKDGPKSVFEQMKSLPLGNKKKEGNLSAQKELLEEFTSYEISQEKRSEARERGAQQEEVLDEQSASTLASRSDDLSRYNTRGQNVLKDYPKDFVYFNDDLEKAQKSFDEELARSIDEKKLREPGNSTERSEETFDDTRDPHTKEKVRKIQTRTFKDD